MLLCKSEYVINLLVKFYRPKNKILFEKYMRFLIQGVRDKGVKGGETYLFFKTEILQKSNFFSKLI